MNEVDPDLLSFLKNEEGRSFDGALLDKAEVALKSYNGDFYGDEEDGRSQVVARDVSETTDYQLTSILEAMAGSGRIVEFEPTDESEVEIVNDMTDALHIQYRKGAGFRFIHDTAKAGLIEPISISKSAVERKKKRVEQDIPSAMLPGETEEELRAAGIIEAEEIEPQFDEMSGIEIPMHRVVMLQDGPAEFPDYYVPLEEFSFSPDTRDFETSPYLCHHPEKTISDLVEMGFDLESVESARDDGPTYRISARDDGRDQLGGDRGGVLRKVQYREEYVLYDLNGDGIAERLCVQRVGGTILTRNGQPAIEEVSIQPFEAWSTFPMHGRLVGQSSADKTMDIQRVNTVLERLMLDSGYMSIAPGMYIDEAHMGDHTVDDILTIRPGRIIRTRGGYPVPEQRNDVTASAMAMMEFKIRQRESRTGITRLNKGIDEDTLNDTARGQEALMSRGQQMERYILRIFAEFIARLFIKKVAQMRENGAPFKVRVDGNFREVNPAQWPENVEVNIKVGLGSGSKEQRVMGRQVIGGIQGQLKMAGSPIVTDDDIYNNAVGLARDLGLQPNDLFTEPPKDEQGNPIPAQQQPDPEMIKAQAELELKKNAHEMDVQLKGADLQAKQQEASLKLELERAKAEEAAKLARDKAEFEREQAISQMYWEREIERERMEHERALSFYKADKDAEAKKYRDGGSLAA